MASSHLERADDELALTIGRYALRELTLGQAAEHLDITRWEMQDILEEANIPVRRGPQSVEEARDEIETALQIE